MHVHIENVIQKTPQVPFEHPQTSTKTQGYQKHWSTCIKGKINHTVHVSSLKRFIQESIKN